MAKHLHQHPFTSIRLALAFVAVFGLPFAIIGCVRSPYSSYYTYSSLNFLPIYLIEAALFIADFVLSLIDIITTSQPRRIDAILDGVAGLGYLALFVVSLVFSAATDGVLASEAVIIASAIHIFACVKNANLKNRVHWTRDAWLPNGHASQCKCMTSHESFTA